MIRERLNWISHSWEVKKRGKTKEEKDDNTQLNKRGVEKHYEDDICCKRKEQQKITEKREVKKWHECFDNYKVKKLHNLMRGDKCKKKQEPAREFLRIGFSWMLLLWFLWQPFLVHANALELTSPSAILMEASTGTVLYEKNANEQRSPASITKIMTLLLIFEAIEKGEITTEDEVVTSEYAMSMGGSQVFLEAGEIQTVDTLIKCIAVASGNDASVAMAEYVSGSEAAFVDEMNAKALELGLTNTHFVDCCGLSDSENHYTSAQDVAIMAQTLISNYPEIYDYTTIWMEDIVHSTARGEEVFTLSSTNKLLVEYPYTTGLKTGSTSLAKYCLCATAQKDGMDLIAVVMGAPDYRIRFDEARLLLEYGFSEYEIYRDDTLEALPVLPVSRGQSDTVSLGYEEEFVALLQKNENNIVTNEITLYDDITAPIQTGEKAGEVIYYLGMEEIGRVNIICLEDVLEAQYRDYFWSNLIKYLL